VGIVTTLRPAKPGLQAPGGSRPCWSQRRLAALFNVPIEALAHAIPHARTAPVGGGHLIDPAGPEVIAFIKQELESH